MLFVLQLCVAEAQTPGITAGSTHPFVLGVTETLHSALLKEDRIVNIYLPEGYKENDTTTYPVIYLLDGGRDEDFIHIVGVVQYNSFSWIGRVPESIVVGIANTDRKRDFTFPTAIAEHQKTFPTTGHSAQFISFLAQELQPYIAGKYRAGASRTLIGQSLGGLLATEILLKQPTLFDQYIIVSPSLWWNNGSLLKLAPGKLSDGVAKQTNVYIGVGKEGATPGPYPHIMEDDARMLADKIKGHNPKVNVLFDYMPDEDHATALHQSVLNAFRLLHSPVQRK
jgi:predicted alpha/beta superfamily hydrolase